MTLYFNGDIRRVNHALKVYGFAKAMDKDTTKPTFDEVTKSISYKKILFND